MIVVNLTTPEIPFPEPKELADADLVVHVSFGRNSTTPPHATIAEIRVLRSRFGDPFHVTVPLDLAFADPELAAAREKVATDEIAAARATLARHGVA